MECCWHDMRHSFISDLAEGENSDTNIMSMAGHVSRKMMERYSHTQNEAKRAAVSILDRKFEQVGTVGSLHFSLHEKAV